MLSNTIEKEMLEFAQRLVQIKSYSGQEEPVIRLVEGEMKRLGYEEVRIDSMGNVLGRMGSGARSILFDAHGDTVEVPDEKEWKIPPFSGHIVDGCLHGRGSVDMKSSIAATVYAATIAKKKGYVAGKTVYVSCTVFEEDCDGENLKHLFREFSLRPDYMVIAEPSNNVITLGHKGKAQIVIRTQGLSAHGAAPEKGMNAVYEMAEIIQRVEKTHQNLPVSDGLKGSLVLSRISSVSASLNAVPSTCEIYLDRRTIPGETAATVQREMDAIIEGKSASWAIGTLYRKSWTGMEIEYKPFHEPWKIDPNHELTQACTKAYQKNFGHQATEFGFWDFSTNAVTPVGMGIPTIGFGPGDYTLAHMRDENCPVDQIVDACRFYIRLIDEV